MPEIGVQVPVDPPKIMKPLIAITTCHRFKNRADAQRATWIKDLDGRFDYKFFLGEGGNRPPDEDEVFLTVPDDYKSLPEKVHLTMKWATEHGYNDVLKCDDDVHIMPARLTVPSSLYEGRVNSSSRNLAPKGWCSGYAYWLRGTALKLVATNKPTMAAEDLWVGSLLNANGITPNKNPGFVVLSHISRMLWHTFREKIVATCEFPGGLMYDIHRVMNGTLTPEETSQNNPRLARLPQRIGHIVRRRR